MRPSRGPLYRSGVFGLDGDVIVPAGTTTCWAGRRRSRRRLRCRGRADPEVLLLRLPQRSAATSRPSSRCPIDGAEGQQRRRRHRPRQRSGKRADSSRARPWRPSSDAAGRRAAHRRPDLDAHPLDRSGRAVARLSRQRAGRRHPEALGLRQAGETRGARGQGRLVGQESDRQLRACPAGKGRTASDPRGQPRGPRSGE